MDWIVQGFGSALEEKLLVRSRMFSGDIGGSAGVGTDRFGALLSRSP